jgi:hypothetical protein
MRWDQAWWRKLYVHEEGSFALLPLYARALAGELLKYCDDDGRIFVGDNDPADVVARLAGADVSDRRLMRKHIPMLLADGYLIRDESYIKIKNFVDAQSSRSPVASAATWPSPSTNRSRTDHEPQTSHARTDHEPITNRSRTETSSGLSAFVRVG